MSDSQSQTHTTSSGDIVPISINGGMTLIAMPGYEEVARRVAELIRSKVDGRGHHRRTPCDVVVPEFGLFPQGEPEVTMEKQHVGGHDCIVITSGPGTWEMLGQLTFAMGYLAGRKARRIHIISGYFPTGRTDKDKAGKQFASPPIVVDALMGASQGKLRRIVCADPHSDQVVMASKTGIVTPVYLTRRILRRTVMDALEVTDKICLAFPDDSACERYEPAIALVEKELGREFPVVVTWQRRKDGTKKRPRYTIGDLEALDDALVITLDDETATGGSQIAAAKIYRDEYGAARVWSAVTHGVLCQDAPQRFSAEDTPIERLYVTDTIRLDRPELAPLRDSQRLHVISWVEDLAWIAYHMHWDLEVRGIR